MIHKCESQDIYRIEVKGEEVLNLNENWYIDAVSYPYEYPINWLDIVIKRKEEPTNENEDIC